MSRLSKRFAHKIYDNTGAYLKTLPMDIVTNVPSFDWSINGGMGEMAITLALTMKDFSENYENTIIKFGNFVRTIVSDTENGDAVSIYSGYITSYEPVLADDGREIITVRVISMAKTLTDQIFKDGANTTKSYLSLDPSNILKNVLDKYGGRVKYVGGSIAISGTTVSYTMSFLTYRDAIDICLSLLPSFWYWFIDADDVFWLKSADFTVVDHKLYIGKQVVSINATKSIEDLFNEVYFKGGGDPPLYKSDSRQASITAYGRHAYKMQDERVTLSATAVTMMTKFLDEHDYPRSELAAKVMDNVIDQGRGYDIESFRPGQVVQILHPRVASGLTLWDVFEWDIDFWDYNIIYSLSLPMQLVEIGYRFDHAMIRLSIAPTDVEHRIEDINRNLDLLRSENIPSAPS